MRTNFHVRRFHVRSGLLVILMLSAGYSAAQTATTQFNVQITIDAECQINSAADLDFGNTGVIDTAIEASSDIAVQCTNGTTYDIGLNEGQGTGASVATRLMTGPDSETVSYSLYTDAGHTDVWGDTIGTDTVSGTGTGAEQVYTVFGQVPGQDAPAPGTYTDVVTVTVTY
uniref:Csu type fimbrial protein n=1 Tax=Halomonas sp. TaxID=1486246 RepID=UPI00263915A2|nr:spore coat U domain-containing protein [Halomonas sp.]